MSGSQPSNDRHREAERRVFGVSALLHGLGRLLEERVGRLWVSGEVSNHHRAASGHVYFSLKDEAGQVRAVMFRSDAARVPFELENGIEILVFADVSIYAARGDLQLIVRRMEPRGLGSLQLAFEQLRVRLEAEGLFDPERKRALPACPRRLGVVTSARGAAVRDVIEVAARRFPGLPLLISPTPVQGQGAEHEIAAALDRVATAPGAEDVDVVLLVRGGGSIEDLWSFNTEVVARAIERSPVPVVSGIGHETDLTIADLVADVRAPTPSAAAMAAMPHRDALASELVSRWRRLEAATRAILRACAQRLGRDRHALRVLAPTARLASQRARMLAVLRVLRREIEVGLLARRNALAALVGRLESLSPLAVLARGYALARRERDGRIVRRPSEAPPGERLRIRVAEGEIAAIAEATAGGSEAGGSESAVEKPL